MPEPINFFPPAEPALASQKNAQEFAKVQAQSQPSDADLSSMTREFSDSDLSDMKPEAAPAPAAQAAPPTDDDLSKLKRVYTPDDVTKTPVMDLVKDKEFDPKAFAAANPDAATDPAVLAQLREVYRQHKIAGMTLSDVGEGVKGIPAAVGSLAKGAWDRVKNLHDIYLRPVRNWGKEADQAEIDAQKKALGENAAATESAAVGLGHFIKGAGEKFLHNNPLARATGVDIPTLGPPGKDSYAHLWENMSPGELDQHFFSDVADAKQAQAVASGEGEKLKGTGYSASELAKEGITLDPANIESLTVTDPLTLAAFEGGFKIVNGATGKLLGTAANSAAAQKAIQSISDTVGKAAGQVVGQPVKLAGAAVKGIGTLAEKTGHAGVTGAVTGLATGHLSLAQAGGIVAADLGAPLVKKAGEAIKDIGKQITGELPMTTGARRIVDLGKAGGVVLKDIGTGAAVGAGTALATSESPEDTESLVSYGGAFGAAHAPKEALGKVVAGEFIQPKAMANTRSSAYGENPALDKATAQAIAAMPADAQNTVNFARELARKVGARVYALPDESTAASVIQSAYPNISPEQAGQIAGSQGFSATLNGADGKPQQVVFLNGPKAAGHEMGHVLEKLMPDDLNKKLDAATQTSFSPNEWDQKGKEYTERLLQKPTEDWRTDLKPVADANGMSADQYLSREGRAENFDALMKNRGADIGTPDDLYRRLVGFAGRTAEKLGAPLVSAKSDELNHPLSLDIMAKSDDALRKVLGDEKASEAIKARDIELRKTAKGSAPATPAPELPKSREEWTANSLKSQKLEDAEKWAMEHGDDKSAGIVRTIAENQRANPEEPNPLRVTRQSVTEANPEQDRTARRAERQKAYDNMDEATRQRVQDVVSLIKMERIKKDNGMHLVGVDMNHVVDNAQRLAEQIAILPDNARKVVSPYATDLKSKSFTPAAWDELLNDYYNYSVNQRRGFKGGGSEAMKLPADAQQNRVSIPPESPAGPAAQLSRDKELFLNLLNGPAATIPKTARESRTGGMPGNLVAQDIAAANGGDIVQPKHPIKGSPEFKSFPGREIMETNPLRATLIKAGIAAHELRDVEARFNLKDVESVVPLSTVRFQARNTDTVRGGFLPKAFEGRPVAESAKDIGAMPDAEWADTVKNYQGKLGGGLTGLAWDLGASAKTPEDVAALRDAVEKLSGPIKEARDAGDMDKAYGLIGRSQAAREAYEAATGRSLDGSNGGSAVPAIRKYIDKTYNPPVPAEAVKGQAMPSDHPDAVKVGAVVRDDETGRLFKGVTHYAALDNRKQDMHDEGKKLGHRVTQGFVSNSGEFLTRQQAATRAEEHGQVPEGYFDSRPGSMGLESTMFEHYNNVFKPDMGENHPRGAFNGQARPPVRSTDDELLKIGQDYAKSRGAAFNNDSANHEVNTPLMHEVADWYQSAKDEPAKPEVAKSYNAFKKETLDQYNALTKAGYSIEPWQKEGQPYANSAEAIADLRDNKHLFYFPSEGGFGDGAVGSDKVAHPLMEDSGVKLDGQPVPFNDLFRAVHDVFGHGLNGNSFGPRGEFNAWKDHAWLYSDEARPAMSAETLGQNSWVNFGSHLRDESGNVPAKGEEGFTPLANRPFAEQKATVLPANLLTRAGSEVGGQFKPKSVFNEGKTTDEHADDFIRAKGQALPEIHDEDSGEAAKKNAPPQNANLIRLRGFRGPDDEPIEDPSPVKMGVWYSRRDRSWVTQQLDKAGNQMGAAGYSGNKKGALLEAFAKQPDSFWGIESTEEGDRFKKTRHSATECTGYARAIQEMLGEDRVSVYGFFSKDNPKSKIAEEFGGHDFAVVDGRYIVDPWATDVADVSKRTVLDLRDPKDQPAISELYGDSKAWKKLKAAPKSEEDMTWREGQAAPKRAAKTEDEFTFPKTATPGGFKRAWILPNGKVEQIGGDWHHQWLDNHRDVVKKYGMDVPPFEGQDAEGPREEALRKGFVRVNYNSNNGLLTVEARAKDWPKQKGQVQQIAEANIGNIDRMRVSLMDDKAVTLKDSAVAPLFNYDDKEKLEHLPFISEGAEEVRTAARGPAVPITAEKDTPVFGGYGGELTFKVFDKAGGLVDTYKNYGLAEEHAQRIGGSIQMKKTFAGAALPKKDKGYEAGEYWLGGGKLHNAPDGHEQWAVDKYGGEHSGGEEDTFPMRHETYGKAEADGYLRTVIQSDAIDITSSEKYPTWSDVPRSSKQALEDAAFRKGVRVLFDGRTVIDEPNIPEGQAQPKLSEEPEAIKEAAVKYGNEIFTGATHGAASEKVRKKYGRREAIKSLFGRGFVTNEGKFLDQEAAMRRAKEYGQIPDDYASPRLESVSFYKNQFQPARFDDAGFDDSLKQVRSGAVGGHTFNPDGTVWTPPPNKKSDIVTLASVNVPEGQSLPKKTTLAEDQGLPGFDMGRSYNRRAISEMTKDELKGHFPEAIVPHSADEKISSNVVGSPLAKQAGSHEEAVKAFSDKLVDFAKSNEHLDEFKSGAKWYSEFTPMLKKEFGADAPLFAELLAATSPQTDPHQNFNYAFDAFQKFKRGDYKAKLDKFEDGLSRLNDGRLETAYKRDVPAAERPENLTPAKLMGWWIDKHDLVVRSSGDKKIGLHSHAVLQVLARRWLTQSTGLKTHNFVQNLIGTGDGATIDLWADRTMRRLGYEGAKDRWRILPENATGVTDDDFKFSQEAFAHAAERLKMKPSALQGALWFAEKKLWADKGWSRLNLGDYRTEMDSLPLRRKGWAQQEKLKGVPTGDLPIRKRGAKQVEFSME